MVFRNKVYIYTMKLVQSIEQAFSETINYMEAVKADNLQKICLTFVPGLLGVAYPLIILTINRLNDQYKSTHLVDRFKKETKHKLFFRTLVISVLLTVISFFHDSIKVLGFLSVLVLIVLFFLNIRLLLTYQSPKDLFQLYLSRLDELKYLDALRTTKEILPRKKDIIKAKILELWHPIIDLYRHAIVHSDRKLETDIMAKFISKTFSYIKYVDQVDKECIEFPAQIYNSSTDMVLSLIKSYDENDPHDIAKMAGYMFFTENYRTRERKYLHLSTVNTIWRNLSLLVENDMDNQIYRYWSIAHQHCSFNFSYYPDYNENYTETDESKEFSLKNSKHKETFIELHTALGAYIMFKEKFQFLSKIWFFTQSQPPHYELLPKSMSDIFQSYFSFLDYFFETKSGMSYYFRNLSFDAMNNEADVKMVIRRYICLLFLKQWITPGFYGQSQFNLPSIPQDQSDKKYWEENLVFFRKTVENHLQNHEMMIQLNMNEKTSEEYCKQHQLQTPTQYLDNLVKALQDDFERTLQEQNLSAEKKGKLDEYTVKTITEIHNDVSRIKGKDIDKNDQDNTSKIMQVIRGTRILLDKETLVENTSVSHLNYDSFLGDLIKHSYSEHIATKFFTNKTVRYKVKHGQFFDAIDRLGLDPNTHAIVAFNVNLDYLQQYQNIKFDKPITNEDRLYKEKPIYCFNFGVGPVNNTIYVLQKEDFPMIKHKDWKDVANMDTATKARWEAMDCIDENLKIYRKFTELDEDEELLEKYVNNSNNKESELRNKVEVEVDFLGYFWFKKGIKIVEIKEARPFQEGGETTRPSDILPF